MKKTLLIGSIFLASVLVGCGKYASLAQAKDACYEWTTKGERIDYTVDFSTSKTKTFERNRMCKLEEETNQFLGYQGEFNDNDRAKAGKEVWWKTKLEAKNLTIVKHFHY